MFHKKSFESKDIKIKPSEVKCKTQATTHTPDRNDFIGVECMIQNTTEYNTIKRELINCFCP